MEGFFAACRSPHSNLSTHHPLLPSSSLPSAVKSGEVRSQVRRGVESPPPPFSTLLLSCPFVQSIRSWPSSRLRVSSDTLVYRWYHRSWLQPLSFYPSPAAKITSARSSSRLATAFRIREETPLSEAPRWVFRVQPATRQPTLLSARDRSLSFPVSFAHACLLYLIV